MKGISNAPGSPKPVGPYTPAIVSGGFVYCSGQIGVDPENGSMAEGVEAQTHRALGNLTAVLKASGSDMSKVVMTTIFVADMADYGKVNEIYASYVSREVPPARQTIAVKELPRQALIEVSVIAEI